MLKKLVVHWVPYSNRKFSIWKNWKKADNMDNCCLEMKMCSKIICHQVEKLYESSYHDNMVRVAEGLICLRCATVCSSAGILQYVNYSSSLCFHSTQAYPEHGEQRPMSLVTWDSDNMQRITWSKSTVLCAKVLFSD